ncbi:NAD(P)/FAD-dependent oxidoreductase [Bordetella petrii]|uniref:NAD(P)/FAD-dependent oxidoreductase n=1 Tax=Bordetella petrii TaxID=94624 RepID=UPI001E2B61D7|nr:FAD-dependent oxidoreductase [Bordetella petrii]MCD0503733.1 FAD-binding oxidoreductase [Bordetella petrii]
MTQDYDFIVAGAGMVGSAIAYGLAGAQRRVLLLDGADTDYRAAKANFGLVWVQGKGQGHPDYQRLSHYAAGLWPEFARDLQRESGVPLDYENRGGLHFCVGETELEQRALRMSRWQAQAPELPPCIQMLDRGALQREFPQLRLGPQVAGASLGLRDGHVNPLRLLAALQAACVRRGAQLRHGQAVDRIAALPGGGFEVHSGAQCWRTARLVIAAGLGSRTLGTMVSLDVPLRPQRGQILVTERVASLLPLPASGIRQTAEGSVLVGLTNEEVGYDLSTTTEAAVRMSRAALRILPDLARARLVRQWSCLRIMTPDGCPVYAGAADYPGAWIALCHSGVTLASFHAGPLAQALAGGALPTSLDVFHHERFNVPQAA